ncbi:MAG: HDOD domain-containing protein [Candidatus Hydrogenedentes bacterium]|nr:HDOD domain-containing protein [Candidatus Hydrogenedentota bacterium]
MALTVEQLERKVVDLANLPTLPGILKKISKMTEGAESSAGDVAEVIATDQVLSAKVLRLVNSPVYGFPGRISSVTHAVVLLGFNVVKGLVLGTAVFDTLGQHGRGLWEHSLGCALFSRRLAQEKAMPDIEEVMIAGLLHDLGKVVLSYLFPERYEEAIADADTNRRHIALAERDVFSVDHARVASWVAREWHFPVRLSDPITYHHRPDLAKEKREAAAVVHVADILARGMGYGFCGDETLPELDHEAFQQLEIPFAQLDQIIEDVEMEYAAGADLFASGPEE